MTQQSEIQGPAVARLQRRNRRMRVVIGTVCATALLLIFASLAALIIVSKWEAPAEYRDAAIGRVDRDPGEVELTRVRARVVVGDRRHLVNRVYEFADGNARPRYDDVTDPGAESRHILQGLTGDQAAVLGLLDSNPYRLSPWYSNWPRTAPANHPYDAGPYTMELKITELPPHKGILDILLSLLLTGIFAVLVGAITGWCYFDGEQQDSWLRVARRSDETPGDAPETGSAGDAGAPA